jgi:regulator of RNase E activity RraA
MSNKGTRKNGKRTQVSRECLESLREFETTFVANTWDCLSTLPRHEWYMSGEIQSVTPTLGPTVGIAMTARIDSSTPKGDDDMDLYWRQLEEMEVLRLPIVWVVEAVGSRPDHECIIGDGMAKQLFSVGCLGIVTNGRVRDVVGLLTVPMAGYCRGICVHHCAVRTKQINVPVSVGGITVRPGEIIHAGTEGVIKLPPSAAEPLIEKAPLMYAAEKEMHHLWRRTDLPLVRKRHRQAEVLKRYGFARRP